MKRSAAQKELTELIARLRSDAPLLRSQRAWLADALDPNSKSAFKLILKERQRGGANRRKIWPPAFFAGEYAYALIQARGAGSYESSIREAGALFGAGRRKVAEAYAKARDAGAPPRPLSFFDGTMGDAEWEAWRAKYEAWVEKTEAEIRAAETEAERAAREADEADLEEWRKEREAEVACEERSRGSR